jgi:hypothetical protein
MAKSATPQVWQGATTAVQDRERQEIPLGSLGQQ